MTIWCLRAASPDRADLFKARLLRRADGAVEVHGGSVAPHEADRPDVRPGEANYAPRGDFYRPDEVLHVPPDRLGAARELVAGAQAALRAVRAPRAVANSDVDAAFARDGVALGFAQSVAALGLVPLSLALARGEVSA